jgi:pyrimidine-nucleoside phosphorylase
MRAVDLIRRKRDGGALSEVEIAAFVRGATTGAWPDYQVAAMLMAIVLRGMTLDEGAALTDAMVRSGVRLDWSDVAACPVDKHSTGGVGDKTSLVLAPLAAACGAVVPMMSGRGLGHTGGTLDKLEAIPGFRVHLTEDDMRRVVGTTGCALIGQTDRIAPADRVLYALRDVTATVESVPLIAASILSKKIAEGIGALVVDVKVGRGAFMKTETSARELADWLTAIASRHGVRTETHLSAMDAPLGRAVGNANEVIEAIETLKGRGPRDVEDLSVTLAAKMLALARLEPDEAAAEHRVREALDSGEGLERFRAIVAAQGGDVRVVDDYARLPAPARRASWPAPKSGVVQAIDAERVGQAAVVLGAGRDRVDGAIDPGAGIEVTAPIGTSVRAGEPVLICGAADESRLAAGLAQLDGAVTIA